MLRGERARRGAARRGAGSSAALRTRSAAGAALPAVPQGAAAAEAGSAPAELGSCAAEGAGKPGRPPTGAALSGRAGARSPRQRGAARAEETEKSQAFFAFGTLTERFCQLNKKKK